MKPNPHPVLASIRKRFQDFFERPDTSSGLGQADYGGLWDSISGDFKIQTNKAFTDNDPEEYPIAAITMPKNDVGISLFDIDNGSAAALWVTDSGNWFAVGVDQHPVDCNCEVGTECNRWNGSNITGWTSYTFESGGRNRFTVADGEYCVTNETGGRTPNYGVTRIYTVTTCNRFFYPSACYAWGRRTVYEYGIRGYNSPNYTTTCNTNFATRYNSPNFTTNRNINGYNANLCNRWNEYTFDCETCYPQWIRFFQSVAGTVTTLSKTLVSDAIRTIKSPNETLDLIVQDGPITRFVRAMTLLVTGSRIQVTPYSDQGAVNQIVLEEGSGDLTYEPTGAQVEPTYGIMVYPSEYNQENFIGGIQINRDDI